MTCFRSSILILILAPAWGCGALGNIFIGHHSKSMSAEEPLAKVEFYGEDPAGGEAALVGAGAAAAVLVPLLVDAVQKGIEVESKRYKATYSGRGSGAAFACSTGIRNSTWIRFTNQSKIDGVHADTVIFDLQLEPAPADPRAFRVMPRRIQIDRTASKIAWASAWPWRWPATVVWAPWYLIDDGISKVDMNAQLELEMVGVDKDGKPKITTLGTVDFPLGKIAARELGKTVRTDAADPFLAAMASPYLPAPLGACPTEPGSGNGAVLMNARMTFVEANDLGDVIAKGAEKTKANKDSITKKILGALGAGE